MSRPTIVLATRNPGKIREIRQVLTGLEVRIAALDEFGQVPEPAETGDTFAQNACEKAHYYAKATGQWCLADDSGLMVDALDGLPGVQSARYAAGECPPSAPRSVSDAANNRKLLAALADVAEENRTARFVCCLALSDGQRIRIQTFDTVEGRIGHAPRGENGFGYDPLFVVEGKGRTAAELPADEKNAVSHRGKALQHFARLLREIL
ncbi:MAG: Non-canonical purine NTP pyrophosphatase [Planctomycetes bacterium ADurb.Bin126]|nr:MAG: Non-canonical purine NTP pyrophosphatase [Planctomycetes bacterium ADurb.Bin126]HOD80359.1 RdgB/HAM1 family non-canonical purine NTP pyrophosphatase [Phycisphaerae bacterium]HQL74411.1 RdgB/HAM1 family non-canonical purine NTP pyrophosphatase [Phycisphaerae bacterium]